MRNQTQLSEADRCFQQAQTAAERGNYKESIEWLQKTVQANRFHLQANAHLAWMLSQQGDYLKAFLYYIRLQLLQPFSFEIHARSLQCLWFGIRKSFHRCKDRVPVLTKFHSLFLCYLSFCCGWLSCLFEKAFKQDSIVSRWVRHNRDIKKMAAINDFEYYKVSELHFVISRLQNSKHHTVLDLGSGRSAIPSFMTKYGYVVTTAELDETALKTQNEISQLTAANSLHSTAADFLALPFADNTFDAVTIISTIEHVPGDGDIHAVQELARVVKPGGCLLITVPAGHAPNEQWTTHSIGYMYQETMEQGSGQGFLRLYNPVWIQERLIAPSGMKLIELTYYGETTRWGWLGLGRNFMDAKGVIHPSPLAAPLNLLFTRVVAEAELPHAHWAVACMLFRKNK